MTRPNATATDRFMGKCKVCDLPASQIIAGAAGDKATVECARCTAAVTVKRLYAVKTQTTCNSKCMGAVGPACSCSCGGENHGGKVNVVTTYTDAEALAAIHARQDADEAKRITAAERAANRRRAAFDAWVSEGNGDVVEYLSKCDVYGQGFVSDMVDNVAALKPLTPRQADAVRNCIARDAARAAAKAERAAANAAVKAAGVMVPTGKVTVTGTVASVRIDDNPYGPGGISKMLVVLDSGAKVWSTVPSKLAHPGGIIRAGGLNELKDKRIQLTATITASDRDAAFGFAKRPTAVLI